MRLFDDTIRALLRSPAIKFRLLMTFYLDSGTYRFCDDVVDVSDGTNLWIGASPLGAQVEFRSGRDLSAEPVTLTLDGNHMTQAGINDPARMFSDIMGYLYTQRRVDVAWGMAYPNSQAINLIVPVAALKINTCRLVEQQLDWMNPSQQVASKLEIVLDSLAMRYARATYRTRSHADQQEIDATDMFYSFTADAGNTERTLYWGKGAPAGSGGTGAPGGSGSITAYGGYNNYNTYDHTTTGMKPF